VPANYTFTSGDAGGHTFSNGVTFVTPGRQRVTATDTTFGAITGTAAVTVLAAGDVSVVPPYNPTRVGLAETFSVAVSGSGGVPTGQVQFVIDGFVSDTETLDASGRASFTTSGLTTSYHTLIVNYLGDGNFSAASNTQFGQGATGIKV